jgi:hypothetical protein
MVKPLNPKEIFTIQELAISKMLEIEEAIKLQLRILWSLICKF